MGRGKSTPAGFVYKTYYEQHKEEINRRRREKYNLNPERRQTVLDQNKDYYRRVRRKPGASRTVVHSSTGNFFSMSVVATRINRKPATIREYHRQGVLPEPLHYDTRGWRLYTKAQVLLLIKAFADYDAKKLTKAELTQTLAKGWLDDAE
jgi:hypothetical protein